MSTNTFTSVYQLKHKPVITGQVQFFEEILVDILLHARDEYDDSYLSVAAYHGQLDCCKVIFRRCPTLLYRCNRSKKTALHLAIVRKHAQVVEFLLMASASEIEFQEDIESGREKTTPIKKLLRMATESGETALHLALKEDNHDVLDRTIKLLIDIDPQVDLIQMVDSRGETGLHSAIRNGKIMDMVKLQIGSCSHKELLWNINSSGETALHLAVQKGYYEIVRLLMGACPQKELLWHTNSSGLTALHLAVQKGDSEIVKLLIGECPGKELWWKVDYNGDTAIHLAMQKSSDEIARLMICACPDNELLLVINKKKETVLHSAMRHDKFEVTKLLLDAVVPEFNLLQMIDSKGETALHLASRKGNNEMAKLMIELGTSTELLRVVNREKNTALHLAVQQCNHDIATWLIEADPDFVYPENEKGETPLLIAMQASDAIWKMLVEKSPRQCKVHIGENGWTILHHAVHKGDFRATEDIIQFCPSCSDEVDNNGQNFLHILAKFDNVNVVKYVLGATDIPANVLNMQDKDGNTPLHIAGLSRSENTLLCLLDDTRVRKMTENKKGQKAIYGISIEDEAKSGVYNLGHQRDLKDQSSFDLVVAALIATVSFTTGVTVPGGFNADGPDKGRAILSRVTSFKVFVISNNLALLLSLYTVFLNFSTRRLLKKEDLFYEPSLATFRTRLLLKKEDIIYQLNVATLCTLGAIQAMVVAFITGAYAVLDNLDGLAITVCVCSSFFFIVAFQAVWNMVAQYRRSVF